MISKYRFDESSSRATQTLNKKHIDQINEAYYSLTGQKPFTVPDSEEEDFDEDETDFSTDEAFSSITELETITEDEEIVIQNKRI